MTPRTPIRRTIPMQRRPRARATWVALVAVILAVAPARAEEPRVAQLAGTVEIGSGSPPLWRAAQPGDALAPGDAVRTGSDGRAELALSTGTVRLYANSLLRLPDAAGVGDSERVRLDRGRSLFEVLRRRNGRFEVETPEVVVSVKGTRFGVDLTAALAQVAVFRGLVGVREPGAGLALETLVREGFAAVGGADRPFELLLNGAADPWDAWIGGVPMPFVRDRAVDAVGRLRMPSQAARPEAQAVTEARAAARELATPQAVERALERDPVLRQRAAQLARQRVKSEAPTLPEVAPPAAPAPGGTPLSLPDLAAGQDAASDQVELRSQLQASLLETMVVGAPSMGGGGGSAPFEIELLNGSGGPDQIVIQAAGSSYTFTESEVQALLSGQTTIPGPLQVYLATNGIAGPELQTLIEQMAMLLGNN